MTTSCKQFFISGRVQGVWYRASTVERAKLLGVTGWARNLSDGRVEAVVCGDAEQLAAMEVWFWKGSSASEVTAVESHDYADTSFTGFKQR